MIINYDSKVSARISSQDLDCITEAALIRDTNDPLPISALGS